MTTRRSQAVSSADVRSALQLIGGLHELPAEPRARSEHLLTGLCRVLGARAGTDVVSRRVRPRGSRGGAGFTHEECAWSNVVGLEADEQAKVAAYLEQMDLTEPVSR